MKWLRWREAYLKQNCCRFFSWIGWAMIWCTVMPQIFKICIKKWPQQMKHTWNKTAPQNTSGPFYGPIAGWGSYYTESTNHFSRKRKKKMSGTVQESREKWKIRSWGVNDQEQNQDLIKQHSLLPVQRPWREAPLKTSAKLYTNRLCLLMPNSWTGESLVTITFLPHYQVLDVRKTDDLTFCRFLNQE